MKKYKRDVSKDYPIKKLVIYANQEEQHVTTNQIMIDCVEYLLNFYEEEEIDSIITIVIELCRLKDIWFGSL